LLACSLRLKYAILLMVMLRRLSDISQVGDVDNNLNRADAVLSKANPEDLDLLVLPELAFSGEFYGFSAWSRFKRRWRAALLSVQLGTTSLGFPISNSRHTN
jgi:predicted amidohydrolase